MKSSWEMRELIKFRTKQVGIEEIKLLNYFLRTLPYEIIAQQLLRSTTSIRANYRASLRAKSTENCINKLKVVEEEADETLY